jgi:hypothetical protein
MEGLKEAVVGDEQVEEAGFRFLHGFVCTLVRPALMVPEKPGLLGEVQGKCLFN